MVVPTTIDVPADVVATERKAATLIVNATGADADFTTIAAALAALPAAGGVIYVREGTYTLLVTLTMPDKPVKIIGSGKGVTIIDLAANAIAAFTLGFDREYSFASFSVIASTPTAGQIVFEHTFVGTANAVFEVTDVEDGLKPGTAAQSSPVEKVFKFTGASNRTRVYVTDCDFHNGTTPGSNLIDGGISSFTFLRVLATNGSIAASGTVVRMVRCQITALTGITTLAFEASLSFFQTSSGAVLTISGLRLRMDACEFGSEILVNITLPIFTGCHFLAASGPPTRHLDVASAATKIDVSGCIFGTGFITADAVRTASSDGIYSDNVDMDVTEIGAANGNLYNDNSGFAGSTIIGGDSVVNNVIRKAATGNTTDAFVEQFAHTNTKGLGGVGTIKNTGGINTLTVRREATDAFGTTDTDDEDVIPGDSATWEVDDNVGTALPPFVSFKISVKSTLAGNPTTFSLQHATIGDED